MAWLMSVLNLFEKTFVIFSVTEFSLSFLSWAFYIKNEVTERRKETESNGAITCSVKESALAWKTVLKTQDLNLTRPYSSRYRKQCQNTWPLIMHNLSVIMITMGIVQKL